MVKSNLSYHVDAKCVVVSVDYRLGPEHVYPAAVEDAEEALHWVHKKGEAELGLNLKKFAVGGGMPCMAARSAIKQ